MAHKNRKTHKLRGSATHGYGNRQKHRGAGSRGGVVMAGAKKHKWNLISKTMPGYLGGSGFICHKHRRNSWYVNIGYFQDHIERLVEEGVAVKKKNSYDLDLTKNGHTKLLGSGNLTIKLNIKVDSCTNKAKEKIEAAGGSVETQAPAEKTQVIEEGIDE